MSHSRWFRRVRSNTLWDMVSAARRPASPYERLTHDPDGGLTLAVQVVGEHAIVTPAFGTDGGPPICVPGELLRVIRMNATVILGGDSKAWIGEIEFGNERPARIEEAPPDFRLGEARVLQQQA